MSKKIDVLLEMLQHPPHNHNIFNPWYDNDHENDGGPRAPEIRRWQLDAYLRTRLRRAKYLLLAEAVGYQGGHFSGIAMTSERILLGQLADRGVLPEHVLPNRKARQTSHPAKFVNGFSEPTATIVWQALMHSGLDPAEFVLWNIFPWHPFQPEKGLLSNRTPTNSELQSAIPIVEYVLRTFKKAKIAAVGRKSAGILEQLGVQATAMRHPAQGGATLFRQQFAAWVSTSQDR